QREPHVNAEIFHVGLAQVFRVRVVGLGERVEIKFHLLVFVLLVNSAGQTVVAARDKLRRGLDRVFAQMVLQQFVCNAAAPELIGFSRVFRPRRFLAGLIVGGGAF